MMRPPSRVLLSCGLLALAFSAAQMHLAVAGEGDDVVIKVDDRGMRAAGILTIAVERERGGSDLFLPGTVAIPQQQIRVVAAPAGGLVEAMLISADEPVAAGQPIARLRSSAIVEAQRQFLAAISDEALAADRLTRAQLLFEARATPERELRVAQTEAAQAKSRLDERTQILALMEMTSAEIETLRSTRRIFSSVTLYSPITGTIVTRHSSPGERTEAAAPLFTIAELDPLWVNIQVPAARLTNISVGARVSLPAHGASGKIIRIGRTVEAGTQSAIAVAEISVKSSSVRPGLAVGVNVHVEQNGDYQWSLPSAAVVRHRDRSWVFVKSSEGFRARPVQVVSESARIVLIRANLAEGDQVAVRGILALLASLADADRS